MHSVLILTLVLSLGDDRYPVREASSAALTALGPAAEPWLLLNEHHHDPEIRSRVARLLDASRRRACAGLFQEFRPLPWIDALPLDYPNRREVMSMWLSVDYRVVPEPDPYPSYRQATHRFVEYLMLEERQPACEVRALLGRMRDRCPKWVGNRWTDEN